jgi:DNA-binding LacI/PurR family transcriptional regulator
MALGVLRALTHEGRHVPDDVAVVVAENVPDLEYFTPALTTIGADIDELGETATRLLLRQMEGQRMAGSVYLPHRLVVRESTASHPRAQLREA